MTLKYVTFCTTYKPDCAFVPNAEVIVCLKDDALVVQFDPPCGLPLTTILATICAATRFETGCQNFSYQYTFSYDDEQITDPNTRPLLESDIDSFLCQDCLLDYIQQQVSCVQTGGGGDCTDCLQPLYSGLCSDLVVNGVEEDFGSFPIPANTIAVPGTRLEFKMFGDAAGINSDVANPHDITVIIRAYLDLDLLATLTWTVTVAASDDEVTTWNLKGSLSVEGGGGGTRYETVGVINGGTPAIIATVASTLLAYDGVAAADLRVTAEVTTTDPSLTGEAVIRGFTVDFIGLPTTVDTCGG